MKPRTKGLLVALLQILLVVTLGVKLVVDRSILPRVWADVVPYDPDLPIRGRYVSLQIRVTPRGFDDPADGTSWGWAVLSVEGDQLIATKTDMNSYHYVTVRRDEQGLMGTLSTPIAFFIPEHSEDPSGRDGLMVELTVPKKGPPRPIRLGIAEDGEIKPLTF